MNARLHAVLLLLLLLGQMGLTAADVTTEVRLDASWYGTKGVGLRRAIFSGPIGADPEVLLNDKHGSFEFEKREVDAAIRGR